MDDYNDPYGQSPPIGPNPRRSQEEQPNPLEEISIQTLMQIRRTESVIRSIRTGLWTVFSLLIIGGGLLGFYLLNVQSYFNDELQPSLDEIEVHMDMELQPTLNSIETHMRREIRPFLNRLEIYMNDIYGCTRHDSCGIVTLLPWSP